MTQHLSCHISPLSSLSIRDRDAIATSLCWPGSDFHRKLTSGPLDGTISIVRSGDRILGWARSEQWLDATGFAWPTLEAFVDPEHRRAGVATFAALGLVVETFAEEGYGCAVFAPTMLLVAHKSGLHPTLFRKDGGEWRRSED